MIKTSQQLEKVRNCAFTELCKKIFAERGLKGFYRAYFVNCNKDIWNSGFYFGTYSYLKEYGKKNNIDSHLYLLLIGGCASKWILNFILIIIN